MCTYLVFDGWFGFGSEVKFRLDGRMKCRRSHARRRGEGAHTCPALSSSNTFGACVRMARLAHTRGRGGGSDVNGFRLRWMLFNRSPFALLVWRGRRELLRLLATISPATKYPISQRLNTAEIEKYLQAVDSKAHCSANEGSTEGRRNYRACETATTFDGWHFYVEDEDESGKHIK